MTVKRKFGLKSLGAASKRKLIHHCHSKVSHMKNDEKKLKDVGSGWERERERTDKKNYQDIIEKLLCHIR